jgi:1-acyl-sn-glycerol-3-phosphate acyltransferase
MKNTPKLRESLTSLYLYRGLKWSVVNPLLHLYMGGKIYGMENVPLKGPVIAVSNHASYFDPPFLSVSLRRPVAFMAKEELFQVPVLADLIRLYGAYPVKRGSGDRGAIRAALNALTEGWIVGVFLEGTRTADARINNPKLGAAMIAAKAQAPILPVSLWGTEKILKKGSSIPQRVPVTLRIGEIIQPPVNGKREELERVTQECQHQINAMHDLGR